MIIFSKGVINCPSGGKMVPGVFINVASWMVFNLIPNFRSFTHSLTLFPLTHPYFPPKGNGLFLDGIRTSWMTCPIMNRKSIKDVPSYPTPCGIIYDQTGLCTSVEKYLMRRLDDLCIQQSVTPRSFAVFRFKFFIVLQIKCYIYYYIHG